MASRCQLVCFLVFALLCGSSLAGQQSYVALNLDELISSKARVDCSAHSTNPESGTLGTIAIGSPCEQSGRDFAVKDRARLRTLLQRSANAISPASGAMPPLIPSVPFFPPRAAPMPAPAEAPSATIPDTSGASLGTLEYVVSVGFGTPARPSTVILDTGSDVSWIQCQPCSGHCYPQHDPLFDPSKSSTYAAVPCGSPLCSAAGGRCNGTACLYSVRYGDGSSTTGALSQEALTLTPSSSLSRFAFGCGQRNLGDFGEVDGLLGLGRGRLSLPSQAAATPFGGTFSYCLPSFSGTAGFLNVGATKPPSGQVQYTEMVKKPMYPSFYFVELVSINIGGYILPVPQTVFTAGGTLLDSGTTLAYIPAQAYALLRDRFKLTMKGNTPVPPYDGLDACYDFSGQSTLFLPAIFLNFSDGAVFELSPSAIVIFPDTSRPGVGCLGFAARPETMPFSIIGNTQQQGSEVIYDVPAEKIGFVTGSC